MSKIKRIKKRAKSQDLSGVNFKRIGSTLKNRFGVNIQKDLRTLKNKGQDLDPRTKKRWYAIYNEVRQHDNTCRFVKPRKMKNESAKHYKKRLQKLQRKVGQENSHLGGFFIQVEQGMTVDVKGTDIVITPEIGYLSDYEKQEQFLFDKERLVLETKVYMWELIDTHGTGEYTEMRLYHSAFQGRGYGIGIYDDESKQELVDYVSMLVHEYADLNPHVLTGYAIIN